MKLSCIESSRNVNWYNHFENSLTLPSKRVIPYPFPSNSIPRFGQLGETLAHVYQEIGNSRKVEKEKTTSNSDVHLYNSI